jgi:hypothetical protein
MTTPKVRHARDEATALLPAGHEARVLEPSPPAVTDPDWFADDPTDPAGASGTVVTPIPGEGITWNTLVLDHPDLAGYASEHWLGAYHRLNDLPGGFAAGRDALHQLAFFAVAPKRFVATTKLALRFTHGGFGTPFFGADEQVRVEGDLLVHQHGNQVRSDAITNLEAACRFLGIPYRDVWFDGFHDPLEPAGAANELVVDPHITSSVADWFGFASSILEEARRTSGAADASRVQLWPEHFDLAFEMGALASGQRASYGASPGDDGHPEPYLYVAAWGDIDRSDSFWNDKTFNGASLSYAHLLEAEDQRGAALKFLRQGHAHLTG